MKRIKPIHGSIALISILIISAFTLILVVGMSETNILTSTYWLNANASKNTYYGAESCLEEGMKRLKADAAFVTTTLTLDAASSCTITFAGGAVKTISITAQYDNYTQHFSGQASFTQNGTANNVILLSWGKI
ncbi:hypothetical protein KBD59_04675 [Candidatus Gracilibacteria bacterium]|nr:hypothetical protein [Candidatus Gracilibacteria bacterium]